MTANDSIHVEIYPLAGNPTVDSSLHSLRFRHNWKSDHTDKNEAMSQTERAAVHPVPFPSAPPAAAAVPQFDSDVLDIDELTPELLGGLYSLEVYREQVRRAEQMNLDEAIAFSYQEAALQKLLGQEEDTDSEDEFELVSMLSQLEEKPAPKCSCCLEPVQNQGKQRVLPCKHMYCVKCIAARCRVGLRDRAFVPAHCCKKEYPVEYVEEALSRLEMSEYTRFLKEKRWQSLDLLSDKEYASVVRNSGGKQCPGCGIGVQRSGGCNRMKCSNNHEFCFDCGKAWKTCPCYYPG